MGIAPASGAGGTTVPAGDQANQVLTGSFASAPSTSPAVLIWGAFNMAIWGSAPPLSTWTGTVRLERSFDGGTTWLVCGVGAGGNQAIYDQGKEVSITGNEPEKGVVYRLNCTALSAGGPLNYRISASGLAAMPFGIAAS